MSVDNFKPSQARGADDQVDDDDLLGVVGDVEPILNCNEVTAVCRDIRKVFFGAYRKTKWVFEFCVVEPTEYSGERLHMFLNVNPLWFKGEPIARSSKLFRCTSIARGCRLERRQRIGKATFVGKLFQCRLRQVGTPPTNYTVIDTIIGKVTG